jgi:hypothetical protein
MYSNELFVGDQRVEPLRGRGGDAVQGDMKSAVG